MNEFLLSLVLSLGLPLLLSGRLAFAWPGSWLNWLLSALLCAAVSVYMYLAGWIWSWIGFGWRILPLMTLVAAMLWSVRRLRTCPFLPSARHLPLAGTVFHCLTVALIVGMLANLQMARLTPVGAVDLSLPLAGGRFAVLQGGGAAALNYHRAFPAQAYATDIVALNQRGRRARGLRPGALDAYEIYDRDVIAPCDGIVLEMLDGAPDALIGQGDLLRPAGNHVLLFCVVDRVEITLLLAHLRPGSVVVAYGDQVRRGTLLGRVGNSGNSTEPHLHIHAVRGRETDMMAMIGTSEAVPLTFNGRFLTRNTIIYIPETCDEWNTTDKG